jgi:hypothetical protein
MPNVEKGSRALLRPMIVARHPFFSMETFTDLRFPGQWPCRNTGFFAAVFPYFEVRTNHLKPGGPDNSRGADTSVGPPSTPGTSPKLLIHLDRPTGLGLPGIRDRVSCAQFVPGLHSAYAKRILGTMCFLALGGEPWQKDGASKRHPRSSVREPSRTRSPSADRRRGRTGLRNLLRTCGAGRQR